MGSSAIRPIRPIRPIMRIAGVNHAPAAVQPFPRFPLTFAHNENCCCLAVYSSAFFMRFLTGLATTYPQLGRKTITGLSRNSHYGGEGDAG